MKDSPGPCVKTGLRRRDRVSKTASEPDACVSAEGETRKGGHGVPDPVFAFRSRRHRPHQTQITRKNRLK